MPISLIMLIIQLIIKLPDIIETIADIIEKIRGLDRPSRAKAYMELKPILKRHVKNGGVKGFCGPECGAELKAFKDTL